MQGDLQLSTHQSAPPSEAPLSLIIELLDIGPLRDTVERIFRDLTRLLGYLSYMKDDLHRAETADDVVPQFMLVEGEGRSLLNYIEAFALQQEGLSDTARAALDGASYVIRHELHRVFETELDRLSTTPPSSLRSRVIHAHGILCNCFQQATIALAKTFDPKIDAADLFDDFQVRRDQSLLLDHDLANLIRLARSVEVDGDDYSMTRLIKSVDDFRNGSMRYLMFKDWDAYERFAQQVVDSRAAEDRPTVLHRFSCFLEMLHAHVKMRAVLSPEP